MPLLTTQQLSKSYGSRALFQDAAVSLEEGEKVGLIGANGAGKSSLMRILAGLESPDSGTISLRRGATVGYLPQEPTFDPDLTILEAAAAGRPEMIGALREYEAINERMLGIVGSGGGSEADRLLARQGELMSRIDTLGGWDWQHEVERILTELGVFDWARKVDGLSGGERKRVALARVLLDRPDLLLLDEPTNHLDADTTLWLEDRLLEYPGAVLLVTHDRYFLDRVVTRMVEIEGGRFSSFDGGYTEYLEARTARADRRATEAAKQARLMEQELAWVKRSPAARTGKQKARIKRLDDLQSAAEAGRPSRGEVDFTFAPPPRLGRTVLDLEGISKSFEGRPLIRGLSTRIRAGERIGVIGPNGAGKTTLLRIIMGQVEPDAGEVRFGVNTAPAYYDQARMDLDPGLSVYDSLGAEEWVEFGGRKVHLRSYLESFLFPTRTHEQRVGSLSGGERNRLLLARLLLQEANLLILDEPTNDLDLQTLQVLEAALAEFGGSVLVVTHDRFFLDKVVTGLLVFEADGAVQRHEGGYELYRRLRAQAAAETAPPPQPRREPVRTTEPRTVPRPRKLSYRERTELEGIEEAILAAEETRDTLAVALSDPALYAETPDEVAGLRARFEEAERRVETLYARWAELEQIAAGDATGANGRSS
jgi:ABC transport system ATP-binding/permease protein